MIKIKKSSQEIEVPGAELVKLQSGGVIFSWGKYRCVWNTPLSVTVLRGGQRRKYRVIDINRLVQISFWGISIVLARIAYRRNNG